jgi:hypothetical protein
MQRPNQIMRLLGRHYRELLGLDETLPIEMEVLLLRLALRQLERAHYGMRAQPRSATAAA